MKPPEVFDGDALALFQACYRDTSMPMELRLAAARRAGSFEHATLQPKPEPEKRTIVNLDNLV